MKDFSIAFRYNGWFRFGWIFFPQSCVVLAFSGWYFIANIYNYAASLHASYLVESAVLLCCFTFAPIFLTKNGKGTLTFYRKTLDLTLKRVERNKSLIAAGLPPLKLPWESKLYATTYCARAGVKAAACEMNFALSPDYLKWWCIVDTNSRLCTNQRRTGK